MNEKRMSEDQLLNLTLDRIQEDDTTIAYQYLVEHLDMIPNPSSQVYNFLYCLAATSGHDDKALEWMEEAVIDHGMWYRPEVFEDDDLITIKSHERYIKCKQLSEARYEEAKLVASTVLTWKKKQAENIILVLHGNQQNNEISRTCWSDVSLNKFQIEYLQSEEIDSFLLYRWEENGTGPSQLVESTRSIPWTEYDQRVLAGFSAGCNVILRTLAETDIVCETIILMSPWIPYVKEQLDAVTKSLLQKSIKFILICGSADEVCFEDSITFVEAMKAAGVPVKSFFIEGLGHEYPDDFTEIIRKMFE